MCGIAGFFASEGVNELRAVARVRTMLRAQAHRGPDGAGLTVWDAAGGAGGGGWVSAYAADPAALAEPPARHPFCVLGHNLLAIQDLTPAARQPMLGGRGESPPTEAIAFNGEIYNFVELRAELEREGETFQTRGDTEVLLSLWGRGGAACLPKLRGMFAFAAFESRERRLWLVRDPFGIKPLYYTRSAEGLHFASEIRSLHACGAVRRALRDSAVIACAAAGVNKFGDEQTLYEDVHELPPGHWLTIGPDGAVRVERYQDLPPLSPQTASAGSIEALAAAVRESVTLHLRASRRIATCLSGGLDSTTVAWLVGEHAARTGQSYDTFTVCTAGPDDSEVKSAALVAERAGLRHHVLAPPEIRPRDVLEMAVAYESPNHVVGPINQFLLLRRIAEEGVTVVLDGQGGDELLSGYPWYVPVLLADMERRGVDTTALRAQLATRLPLPPETAAQFDRMFHDRNAWVEAFVWQGQFLGWSREAVAELPETHYYLYGGGDWAEFRRREYHRAELQYLLRQEDRLGMWFGLECRVPFVDRPLVAHAASLSPETLIKDGYLKHPLRVMLPGMPDQVRWETRKRGFWETDRARFAWLAEAGKRLASSSDVLRRVFPSLPEQWDTLSFDQHWRLTQLAVNERCATRDGIDDLMKDAGLPTEGRAMSDRPLRLHVGHHFFGSGNIGDDLMLAGFLLGVGPRRTGRGSEETHAHVVRVSCASPYADAQRNRFPEVQWFPYDLGSRAAAIGAADAWVGVGGSPFQLVVGPWFLDHLAHELALCKRYGRPMYFLGVGVNERAALDHPHARAVLEYASHVWTRDAQSTAWIADVCGADKVTEAADLAHVAMRSHRFLPVEPGVTGYVLNFEDASQFRAEALCEVVAATPGEQRWLVQEVRELVGSERAIHAALPDECRSKLVVRVPDYAANDWRHLVDAWGAPEKLVTSRYHATIVGAWAGSEVIAVCRSDKVRGAAQQLGLATVEALTDASSLAPVLRGEGGGEGLAQGPRRDDLSSIRADEPGPSGTALKGAAGHPRIVPRETLHRLASRAQDACDSLLQQVSTTIVTDVTTTLLPNRVAFASLDEMNGPIFRSFMSMMNAFATAHGLRTFTNWTKIWEYPWLWHACLSGVPWRGARLVDLGSEISPMPWFLATLGASVHLVEVDPQWEPAWVALREKLAVDVQWSVVKSEKLPVPDGWADVVTSFSVIEHQPDKRAAIAEVVRALRPGGAFAVSFDICEAERGMTFPEWNGRALTVREFEDELWLHPAFGNTERPRWEWELVQPFLEWHRTTAPHHNYVAAAAVLRKR